MASGISLKMRYLGREKPLDPRPKEASRDRSLPGKDRIRARKAARRGA